MFTLKSPFQPTGDQPQAIKKLTAGLDKKYDYQTLLGVTGSGKTFSVANIIAAYGKSTLVIAPNKTLAAQLYREYKNFFPDNSVHYFVSYYDYYQPEAYMPNTDTYIDKEAMINEEIDRLRHEATSALLTRDDVIIVASVSCIYNLGTPENYTKSSLRLTIGQSLTRSDLIRQLVKIQFERTAGALERGRFRVRGDNFEIMPASEKALYRIKLDGQKIASVGIADPLTRKLCKAENLNEIIIFPPQHFNSTFPEIKEAIENIRQELRERLAYFKKKKLYLEAERLERRTRYDIEMMQTLGYCHGIENYSRHLTGKLPGEPPDSLLAYFPQKNGQPDFLTIVDESHITLPQIGGMYAGDRSRKETLIQYGWRLPSALDNRPLQFAEWQERVGPVICTTATPGKYESAHSKQTIEQIIRPTGLIDPPIEIRPVYEENKNEGQVDDIMRELKKISAAGERAIINVMTKKMAEDLYEYLLRKGFKANYIHSDIKTTERGQILTNFRRGKFNVLIGVNLLREGLDLPEVTLVAIMDSDREGFLRSESSLIQTMGRTARNVRGKVILYADEVTGSMKRAINEVNRRREIQRAYNKKHDIKPRSVEKEIEEYLDI
ncbi:excinuclease ABC subunit UvrB [Patescibacteria group bacterium]|nr:excinuclease ABC subunit UvrB [Patescibacteria group bacterium]